MTSSFHLTLTLNTLSLCENYLKCIFCFLFDCLSVCCFCGGGGFVCCSYSIQIVNNVPCYKIHRNGLVPSTFIACQHQLGLFENSMHSPECHYMVSL